MFKKMKNNTLTFAALYGFLVACLAVRFMVFMHDSVTFLPGMIVTRTVLYAVAFITMMATGLAAFYSAEELIKRLWRGR